MMMGFYIYFFYFIFMFRCYFRGGWYGFVLYSVLGYIENLCRGIYSEREFKVKMLEGLRYELSIYTVVLMREALHLNILV